MNKKILSESALERMKKEYTEWLEDIRKPFKKIRSGSGSSQRFPTWKWTPLYTPLEAVRTRIFFEDIEKQASTLSQGGSESTMYRARLWTMRNFAGLGASSEDTDKRFRLPYRPS